MSIEESIDSKLDQPQRSTAPHQDTTIEKASQTTIPKSESAKEETDTEVSLPPQFDTKNNTISEQEKFLAALDTLAEIEPLLRQNPELLVGARDELGRQPLDVLLERVAALHNVAEQFASATS